MEPGTQVSLMSFPSDQADRGKSDTYVPDTSLAGCSPLLFLTTIMGQTQDIFLSVSEKTGFD